MKGAFPKQTTYLRPSNLTVVGFERFYSGAGVRCVFFCLIFIFKCMEKLMVNF